MFCFAVVLLLIFPDYPHAQSERIEQEIRKVLEQADASRIDSDLDWNRLQNYYSTTGYHQLWGDRFGPSYRAQQLRHVMRNADRDGLNPDNYHLFEIDRRWSTIQATDLAELELLLTDAFFRYSVDLSQGHYKPYEVDPVWNIEVPEIDPVSLLESVYGAKNFNKALQELAPPHAGYRWLRDALGEYRELARQGGWPRIYAVSRKTR